MMKTTYRETKETAYRWPVLGALCVLLVVFSGGCHRDMWDQKRYEPLEKSSFYEDGLSARPSIEGTVPYRVAFAGSRPYEFARLDSHLDEGTVDGEFAERLPLRKVAMAVMGLNEEEFAEASPQEVRRAVIERGQSRFNITCAQCHGRLGDGQGMIVKRGFPRPPSYHIDRLREVPDGYIFDVITNGFGRMFSYSARIKPVDRWAVVAYVRTLQLSQNVSFADLGEAERETVLASANGVSHDDDGSHDEQH